MDIFISYKSEYREYARWLKAKLTELGFSVWLDVDNIPSGSYFADEIDKGLEQSQLLVILVTPGIFESRPLKLEMDYFLYKGKPVIPIIIGDTEIPVRLSTLQYIDFREDREKAFERLAFRLRDFPNLITSKSGTSYITDSETQYEGMEVLKNAHKLLDAGLTNQAIAEFGKALEYHQTDHIKLDAINTLGKLKANNAAILRTLQDPSVNVRKEAIIALAKIRSAESRLALQISALQDESLAVRLYASTALLIYESIETIPTWLKNLSTNSKNPILNEAITGLQLRISELITNVPKHAFISYSRSDSESFTISLTDNLRNSGFSVWIDTNLEPGSPVWMHDIEKAIQQAGVCIVVLSPAIHESQWVPKEVEFARQFKKKIIPIKYRDTHKPLYLSTEQGLRTDLAFDAHYQQMYPLLVDTLQRIISRIQ